MSPTLKQLNYALAVARTGHFGQAAAQCHVTQPALSQQIKLLEEACGTPIFERRRKSARPTAFGIEFLAHARQVVAATEQLETYVQRAGHGGVQPIRLGLIPTIAPYLLPIAFPALRDAHPEVEFAISEGKTETLLSELDTGEIDLAVIATAPEGFADRIESVVLFADPFVLAVSAKAEQMEPAALAALPQKRLLLLEEGHCLRDQAVDACRLEAEAARLAFAATSLTTIMEMVALDHGVTLLPAIALAREAADPRIRILSLAAPGAGRLIRLAWRRSSPFAGTYRQIAAAFQQVGITRLSEALPAA